MADEPTPDGEGPARASRPAVRLGRKPARLGAAGRLGSEVAGARASARVLRSATRLTSAPAPAPAADEPPSAPAETSPPPLPAAPTGDLPRRRIRLAGGVDLRGRRRAGDRDVRRPRRQRARARRGWTAAAGRGSSKARPRVRRSRPRPRRRLHRRSPPAAESSTLPPVPGASVTVRPDAAPPARRRARLARAPAGSAQPAPATPEVAGVGLDHARRAARPGSRAGRARGAAAGARRAACARADGAAAQAAAAAGVAAPAANAARRPL